MWRAMDELLDRVMRDRRQFEAVRQHGAGFDIVVCDDAQILGAGEEAGHNAGARVLGAAIALALRLKDPR